MDKIIRRTVTITITESWTIVQDQPKTQEERDETILPAVTTVTATEPQPDDVTAKPKAGGQRIRTRRRRDATINPVCELDVLQKGNSDE